jgi:hypothetical protein
MQNYNDQVGRKRTHLKILCGLCVSEASWLTKPSASTKTRKTKDSRDRNLNASGFAAFRAVRLGLTARPLYLSRLCLRSETSRLWNIFGKAEPYRKEGGKAAPEPISRPADDTGGQHANRPRCDADARSLTDDSCRRKASGRAGAGVYN